MPKGTAIAGDLSKLAVETDVRICFGIRWFDDEAIADQYGEQVRESGATYNGGYYHGMQCGRDTSWDYTRKDDGKKLFAVTF